MADRGGRKWALLASGVPNFIGWLLIALSKHTLVAFKPVILTGRFLTGFASGWLSTVVTVSKCTMHVLTLLQSVVQLCSVHSCICM